MQSAVLVCSDHLNSTEICLIREGKETQADSVFMYERNDLSFEFAKSEKKTSSPADKKECLVL